MHQGQYVLSQLLGYANRYRFHQCVERYDGERYVKLFSCWDQFVAMSFGQLSFRESLRDIVVCLNAHQAKRHHLGFRSSVRRSTLADANEYRDWRIYRDYALFLIGEAKVLYANDEKTLLELNASVYAIDSTTIELCLGLFPWARFSCVRGTVKLNLGIEVQTHIPSFFHISEGKNHDVLFLDQVEFEAGAFYAMDRGYIDFTRFNRIDEAGAFFVTRAKDRLLFVRMYSNTSLKSQGVLCDQTIRLTGVSSQKRYPGKLRRIKYRDEGTGNVYVFLTNNFSIPATAVANIYKHRWQVELFFKWIKQHLSVKVFWGRSANAVKTQICIALSAFLLVAIMKKTLKLNRNSYEILQILSVSLFNKIPLMELISEAPLQLSENLDENVAQLRCF